jgi:hypothetical protein
MLNEITIDAIMTNEKRDNIMETLVKNSDGLYFSLSAENKIIDMTDSLTLIANRGLGELFIFSLYSSI